MFYSYVRFEAKKPGPPPARNNCEVQMPAHSVSRWLVMATACHEWLVIGAMIGGEMMEIYGNDG